MRECDEPGIEVALIHQHNLQHLTAAPAHAAKLQRILTKAKVHASRAAGE